MGRLINPGAGEIADRLTILSLKILFTADRGKDPAHFVAEREGLLSMIRSRTLNGKWFAAVVELAAVNGALWHAEDDLREWRDGVSARPLVPGPDCVFGENDYEQIRQLAFRIQDLNDQRARLVQQINLDAGDTHTQEKL